MVLVGHCLWGVTLTPYPQPTPKIRNDQITYILPPCASYGILIQSQEIRGGLQIRFFMRRNIVLQILILTLRIKFIFLNPYSISIAQPLLYPNIGCGYSLNHKRSSAWELGFFKEW